MHNIIKRKIKSLKKKGKYGAMYMNTVVKVIACVVIGALLISGLAVTLNMSMNTANGKVNSLFAQSYDYEGSGGSGSGGGGGAFVPGENEGPTMLNGANQSYNKLSTNSLTFRSSAPMDTFQEVKINGEVVNSSCYAVTEGSTIITFDKDYSKLLSNGDYTIDIVSDNGTATANFKVTTKSGLYDANGNLVSDWATMKASYPSDINDNALYGSLYRKLVPEDTMNPDKSIVIDSSVKTLYSDGSGGSSAYVKDLIVSEGVEKLSTSALCSTKVMGKFYLPSTLNEMGVYSLAVEAYVTGSDFEPKAIDIVYNGTVEDFYAIENYPAAFVNCPYGANIKCLDGDIHVDAYNYETDDIYNGSNEFGWETQTLVRINESAWVVSYTWPNDGDDYVNVHCYPYEG